MKQKAFYLHVTYIDNYGMQHNLKYKLPRDFQKSVAAVLDSPKPKITFE